MSGRNPLKTAPAKNTMRKSAVVYFVIVCTYGKRGQSPVVGYRGNSGLQFPTSGLTTQELVSPPVAPEGNARWLDLIMIADRDAVHTPTAAVLENRSRIAFVETQQKLDSLISTHGVRNG